MANYANQLTINLNLDETIRQAKQDGESFAPWVFWKYKKAAMKNLTGNGYKLWEYMYSWAGKGKFDLSPRAITEEIGISTRGLRDARQELEECGCLKPSTKNNNYDFYPAAILQKLPH